MAHFTSYDGAKLAFHRTGSGPPLVCLPGGPGRAPGYLGDLGGLGRSRELILPDTRGTGDSEVPADPAAYRCDRIARDVEALRADLGLDQMDLLGHSAGANVALLYAAAHPERIGRLILLTPGVRALGLTFTDEDQQAAMRRRAAEPWFGRPGPPRRPPTAETTQQRPRSAGSPSSTAAGTRRPGRMRRPASPGRPPRRGPASTRRGRSTRPRRGPRWPASRPRCSCTRASWTPPPRPGCWPGWPGRPGSSPDGNSRCSRAPVTSPGWMIRPGSPPRSRRSSPGCPAVPARRRNRPDAVRRRARRPGPGR